jgi:hypothetical protein
VEETEIGGGWRDEHVDIDGVSWQPCRIQFYHRHVNCIVPIDHRVITAGFLAGRFTPPPTQCCSSSWTGSGAAPDPCADVQDDKALYSLAQFVLQLSSVYVQCKVRCMTTDEVVLGVLSVHDRDVLRQYL